MAENSDKNVSSQNLNEKQEKQDLYKCPHCGRLFKKEAYDKHVPICARSGHNNIIMENNNEKEKEENPVPNTTTSDISNNKSPIPHIENYIHPITIDTLQTIEELIEFTLSNYTKKLETTKDSNLMLKRKMIEIKNKEILSLFKEKESLSEINDNEQYESIFDCVNFYHFTNNEDKIEKKEIDKNILDKLFNKNLSSKGTLLLLCDYQYLIQLCQSFKSLLGEKYSTKLFIKLYIIYKLPFMVIISFQKLYPAKEPYDISNEKMLSYELNKTENEYSFSKPLSYTFSQLSKSVTYMYQIYQYQAYFYNLHPGTITPVKIKDKLYSDDIAFTISVIDSKDKDLIALNKCAAVIIGKSFANDFVSLTAEGNMSLCQQCKVSRLLLVRAAPFNFDPVHVIKDKISGYVILFKFNSCVDKSLPIMLMNEEQKDITNVFADDKILIRDVKENDINLRQLIFISNPYQVQCEIKTTLTSKTKLKNNKDNPDTNLIPIKTLDKFSQKNLVQCFDDSFISMFYIQALLCGVLFMDLKNLPKEKIKILVLGAGIGTINYYFDKILKSNVCIDAVELDKNVAEKGKEYFGLNNYTKEKNPNIKWYFNDARNFVLDKSVKDYYDLIVMDINNTNSKEGISPPPVFFEENIINKIHSMLKSNGIYIIDLLARSYQNYKNAYTVLEKQFPHILYIDNNEDLNKIHLCFKTKRSQIENLQTYADGLKLLKNPEIGDIGIIEASANQFIGRFVDGEKQKEVLDAYIS